MHFSSVLVSASFGLVLALPNLREVPVSSCQAISAGLLTSGNNDPTQQGFFFNAANQLEYNGSSTEVLDLAWEPCTPNFGRFNESGSIGAPTQEGHLFMPITKQCLGVQSLEGPTFTLSAVECTFSDDSSQGFLSWVIKDGLFFFPGVTQADGSIIQGSTYADEFNCSGSGFFGYAGNDDGTPKDGVVTLQCSTIPNTFGFGLEA